MTMTRKFTKIEVVQLFCPSHSHSCHGRHVTLFFPSSASSRSGRLYQTIPQRVEGYCPREFLGSYAHHRMPGASPHAQAIFSKDICKARS